MLPVPRTGALLVSVLVLALAVPPGFGIAAQTEPPPARTPRDTAPEWMLYRTLFHTIHLLNAQAVAAEREGRTEAAQALRRAFKREAKLNAEQAAILDRLAAECEQAVRAVDAQARELLLVRRRHYPDGKLPAGQRPLPPSPELTALQQEREAVVLEYSARLQKAFGPPVLEPFVQRILAQMAPRPRPDRTLPSAGAGAPDPGMRRPTTQTPPEAVVTGTTLISYDPWTNLVTAIATTELDYAAQEWYTGDVSCHILDGNGNRLVGSNAYDTDGDGTVSVIVQMSGQVGVTYSAEGRYKLWLDIQNPISGCYLDYWNFPLGFLGCGTIGYYWYYTLFYGQGPFFCRPTRSAFLGRTTFPFQLRPEVISGNPTFTQNPIKANIDTTHIEVEVTASPNIGSNVWAVLDITQTTPPGEPVTILPDRSISVPLIPGGTAVGRFTVPQVSASGTYKFRVRIWDVRKNLGNGQSVSIFSEVIVSNGVISNPPLTVNP